MIEFKRFLSKKQVELWVLRLPSDLRVLDLTNLNPADILDARDLDRYYRFKVLAKKNEIIISRLFLKWLLGKYLQNDLAEIHVQPDTYGKPFLYIKDQILPLYFNLSHTVGLMCYIFGPAKKIGVDVECINQPFSVDAKSIFLPEEIAWCNRDRKLKEQRCYMLWTLKEAYLKADGRGLYEQLDTFGFSLANEAKTHQSKINVHFQDSLKVLSGDPWHFKVFCPTSSHILSLAVQMEAMPLFSLNTLHLGDLEIFSSLIMGK